RDQWKTLINRTKTQYVQKPFALALATDENGQVRVLHACEHAVVGYSDDEARAHHGKYSLFQQPLNRVLMGARREGLKIDPDYMYSSHVPTAREWVDFIGAGFSTLHVGDIHTSRDEHGLQAMVQLLSAGVISVRQTV
ncbi:MAG: deoxycytidylate deaminase, partial [Alphaproteobacteria bacterium]|nr:deoxycytidylate deaminase [Alphaproteobacteria bacterium]